MCGICVLLVMIDGKIGGGQCFTSGRIGRKKSKNAQILAAGLRIRLKTLHAFTLGEPSGVI